ncbi:redoxin family protein [Hanstruepera flava]|uniref:redoxin family protein n=1 Tax=Hanstruepera flava TaxID=2930218 RepID=UPI002028A85D|nr:redoxin family protein [Hanstruepera flava]
MKKSLLALSALAILACQEDAPKDYVTLTGTITNQNSDSLVVRNRSYSKTITVNQDGTFSDTLKVETGIYSIFDGAESTNVFLKNGYELNMSLDTKMFDETVKYEGLGSEQSNFLAQKSLKEEQLLDFDALSAIEDMETLNKTLDGIKSELNAFYTSNTEIDSTITNSSIETLEPMLNSYKRYLGQSIALKQELPKGSESPAFTDYENVDGSKTSLADLKGKYVYVDVWATWCGPCKAEIPHLKAIEKEYHDKNIEFVSLSVDDGRGYKADSKEEAAALAKEGWKKMIAEKELGGIQIIAPEGWQSSFVKDYKISGIPRFILIDPDGNVVNPDAPRPSSDKLKELFTELNI